MQPYDIRPLQADQHLDCERILRALPQWFAIETAIQHYVQATREMDTWLAHAPDGIAGFLSLDYYGDSAADIHVMAVAPEQQGLGCGRALIEHAENLLRQRGIEFLQVKTVAPSHPSEHYARTRAFYRRMGFVPLEENHLWGEQNPCLMLIKHLPSSG